MEEKQFNIEQFREEMKGILGEGEGLEMATALSNLLMMEDEGFDAIAPIVYDNFVKSLNKPNEKLELVRSLNASGYKAEDVTTMFLNLVEDFKTIDTLSQKKKDFMSALVLAINNAVIETEGIAKRIIQVPIEKCHEDAIIPEYAHETDSGMDVYALDDYTIAPGETKLIPTGIKMAIPLGYEIQVRPKSGRALKTKLRVANTPGTIDSGYRDEICVIIENVESPIRDLSYHFDEDGSIKIDSILHGQNHYIHKGEKFAQLVLVEVAKASLQVIDSIANIGENRGGGFGSSGLTKKQENAKMSRIKLDDIRAEVEKDGWKVISQEYTNLDTEMEFLCDEGHSVFQPWKKLRQSRECPICKQNHYKNQDKKIISKKKGTFRVLALDQATHTTGYAVFDGKTLIKYGTFNVSGNDEIARDHKIKEWLISMIENWQPDYIGFEGIQLQTEGGQQRMGVTVFETLARLQGILMETAFAYDIPYKVVHTAVWRNHCGVKGKTRPDKKKSMQLMVKKWFDINLSDDCSDAIGIGKYVSETCSPKIEMFNWE